jgi:glycosyltransferase involved in cell wall biosynthesis
MFALQVAWTLWRDRRGYDTVYFLMQGLHLAAGLPVARVLKKPIVMKFGGSGVIPLMERSRFGRIELAWLRQWAARLMVLNEGMIEEGLRYGFARGQMLWMPNPVDTDEFRPASQDEKAKLRRQFGISESAAVAIYVGRLAAEKGLDWLLQGFAIAAQRVPEAVLVLLGDGPKRMELEALASRLALNRSRVLFAGRVDVTEVPTWLRAGDVFCLTSPSEGFSCALAEAMAVGLPAVVSDIPANRQLVDDTAHGLTVPTGDEAAIGSALTHLLLNRGERLEMGSNARRRIVDNYSSEQVADRYERLFREIRGEASRGASTPR